MIKVSLICIIIAIASKILVRLLTGSMTIEEMARAKFANEYPIRINVFILIHIVSVSIAIITAIIAIILWR